MTSGLERLIVTMLPEEGSKFDPEIVTSPPVAATVGEISEMLGADEFPTVNSSGLVAGPSVDVETVTDPDSAPAGTSTERDHGDASVTAAPVPLNLTVSDPGLEEKPLP